MKKKLLLPIVSVITVCAFAPVSNADSNSTPDKERVVSEISLERPARGSSEKIGSPDDRMLIDPGESVRLNLVLNPRKETVRLEVPNGGMVNHKPGVSEVAATAAGQAMRIEFAAGTNPGRYTLEISQGNAKSILEFWVGPEPPRGRPGPALTFTGSPQGN
jgi:hypothetical protein